MNLAFVYILVYKMISRAARATQETFSQQTNKQTNEWISNQPKPKKSNNNKRSVWMLLQTPHSSNFSLLISQWMAKTQGRLRQSCKWKCWSLSAHTLTHRERFQRKTRNHYFIVFIEISPVLTCKFR